MMIAGQAIAGDSPGRPLLERIWEHAAAAPGHLAYQEIHRDGSEGRALSYADLAARATALARTLRASAGPGATVLLVGRNTCDWPVAFTAALAADCAVLAVSPSATPSELHAIADLARPGAIIGIDSALHALADRAPLLLPLEHAVEAGSSADVTLPASSTDPRLLLLSSGTTSRPKIVLRSGRSLDAVCRQMTRAIDVSAGDTLLAMAPLCHSYGIEHGLLAPLYAGATVRLCDGLDLPAAQRQLASGGVTVLPTVPSVCEMLARLAGEVGPFHALRAAYSAGGPLPRGVYDALRDRLGVTVSQLYGATEIGSVTYRDARDAHFDPGSVGAAMDGVEIRIDRTSQVLVRARSMFAGYLGSDGSEISADGFFATGDLGSIDAHGNLAITGRLKLLIDVGGMKVNPLEVEQVLLEHPDVGECVVVPVRQSETISRIKAIIIALDARRPPDAEAVRQFARQRLAAHKVPRIVELRDDLPRSPTGKVLRHRVEVS